jgi:hypothetical protein
MIYYTHETLPVQTDETARPSQFNLWERPHGLNGKNGLYVWSDGDSPAPYEKYFATTSQIRTLTILRGDTPIRSYSIVNGQNSLLTPFSENSTGFANGSCRARSALRRGCVLAR